MVEPRGVSPIRGWQIRWSRGRAAFIKRRSPYDSAAKLGFQSDAAGARHNRAKQAAMTGTTTFVSSMDGVAAP